MEPSKVIIVVICVLVLAFALYYFFNSSSVYSSLQNAQTMQTILGSSLPTTQGTNYAYSIWIYINDWQTNIGQYKVIFGKNAITTGTDSSSCGIFSDPSTWTASLSQPCPVVYLDEFENNLGVSLVVTDPSGNAALNSIVTDNIVPIQKWVFIAISVYQTILDVYIDGKLASTNILEGLPYIQPGATPNLYITPCGGFNGWTSKMQFFSTPLNPQQVWDLYSQGYGGSYFSNDQNGVTITVNKNGIPQSSFSI
jgi:hypothetical protein